MRDHALPIRPLVALVAIAGISSQTSAHANLAFAGIPDVTIDYYPVDGGDAMAVRRAIDAARPTDAHDGRRVDALSSWDLRWSWPRTRHGGCDLAAATVRYKATVRMPQLAATAQLTAAERADWDRYVAALARHEAGHVRYTYRHRGEILAAIRGRPAGPRTPPRRPYWPGSTPIMSPMTARRRMAPRKGKLPRLLTRQANAAAPFRC
ncbi:DUF922 domain-containing protein [Sphingomonas aerolata]|uniref:DUF922 domain-containing protein n=1 Tax=Sphingomonas aerolata TaxID=185951 RepID=UPI002FDF297B